MPAATKKIPTKPCPACQQEVAVSAKFCNFCGQRITPDVQLEPIEHKQSRERIIEDLGAFLQQKNISEQQLEQLQAVLKAIPEQPKQELVAILLRLAQHTNRHIYTAAWQTLLRVVERSAFLALVKELLTDPQFVPVLLTALPLDQDLVELLWPAVQAHPRPEVGLAFLSRASLARLVLPGAARRQALSL